MPERTISVGSLVIPESDKEEIRKILDSNQISPGPYVRRFETEFAYYHGATNGLFVNSGTDALRIALATLKEVHGWKDGDCVIVPAITFVATVNVILQNNLRPRFVDVTRSDYNLDRDLLRKASFTNDPIRAVIPVHMFGRPCDMEGNMFPFPVMEICRERGWKVIEDSCETMGVLRLSGDIACYSTYVAHLIATGIGGLAITNNADYAEVMRSYANHGRDPYYIPGFRKPELTKELLQKRFRFERIGYSSRVTEMEAALGLGQLYRLSNQIEARRRVALSLTAHLSKWGDQLVLPWGAEARAHAFMMYPILVLEGSGIDKWDLCLYLEKNGIETREMLPLINQPCYEGLKINQADFPVASEINRNGFYIGCHPGVTDEDVAYIARVFEGFMAQHRVGGLTNTVASVHSSQTPNAA